MGGRLPCSCGFEEKAHPINTKGNKCKTFTPGGKPKTLAHLVRTLERLDKKIKEGGYTTYTTADAVYYTNLKIKEATMSDGRIPVNASDLPIDTPPLEESAIYDVVLKKVVLNPAPAKNGLPFCKLQTEVVGGDFEGAFLPLNYLPLPVGITSDMTKGERYAATRTSVAFGRFCRSFKITGEMPEVDLLDAESIAAFQDWIAQFYESTGKVSIRNQEFPVGSGRLSSGINDFIF